MAGQQAARLLWGRVISLARPGPALARMRGTASTAAPQESGGPGKLIISDSAVTRLNQIAGEEGRLRVSVQGGGCSGFQYNFELEEGGLGLLEDDVLLERGGARVVVDTTSLEYIGGATLDFHTELIRSAFRVVGNPQAEGGCSCGASFNIKIDL